LNYVKAAGKLDALITQGVNNTRFSDQLANVRAEFELLEQTWPKDVDRAAIKQFKDSLAAYDLALKLWNGKIKQHDDPMEPDNHGWQNYIDVAGDYLLILTHPEDSPRESFRGKRYIPAEENISVLMGIGSGRFKKARESILILVQ
jgi:hypothetical protein